VARPRCSAAPGALSSPSLRPSQGGSGGTWLRAVISSCWRLCALFFLLSLARFFGCVVLLCFLMVSTGTGSAMAPHAAAASGWAVSAYAASSAVAASAAASHTAAATLQQHTLPAGPWCTISNHKHSLHYGFDTPCMAAAWTAATGERPPGIWNPSWVPFVRPSAGDHLGTSTATTLAARAGSDILFQSLAPEADLLQAAANSDTRHLLPCRLSCPPGLVHCGLATKVTLHTDCSGAPTSDSCGLPRTRRRRLQRQAHGDRLRKALFMVDLQFRGIREALRSLETRVASPPLPAWSRSLLLQSRTQQGSHCGRDAEGVSSAFVPQVPNMPDGKVQEVSGVQLHKQLPKVTGLDLAKPEVHNIPHATGPEVPTMSDEQGLEVSGAQLHKQLLGAKVPSMLKPEVHDMPNVTVNLRQQSSEVEVVDMPKPEVPDMPGGTVLAVPNMPDVKVPEVSGVPLHKPLSEVRVPDMSQPEVHNKPNLTVPEVPTIPDVQVPAVSPAQLRKQLPRVKVPNMPDPEVRNAPNVTMPEMPTVLDVKVPAVPGDILRKPLSKVQVPHMPKPAVPDMPSETVLAVPGVPKMQEVAVHEMPDVEVHNAASVSTAVGYETAVSSNAAALPTNNLGDRIRHWAGVPVPLAGRISNADWQETARLIAVRNQWNVNPQAAHSALVVLQSFGCSGVAKAVLQLTQATHFYYTEPDAVVQDDSVKLGWDPLEMSHPAFYDPWAVQWTEPSTGWSVTGRSVIDHCSELRQVVLCFNPRMELILQSTTAVLKAEALLWRHFTGWARASDEELQACLLDLRRAVSSVPPEFRPDYEDSDTEGSTY